MASWTVKGCTPQTLFAASTWMLLLLAGMSCAQPEQPEPYYVSCYNSVGVNFSNIVSDDAPLGSYDYRTAVFLPEQSPNVTTGVRCAAQCRSIGRQLSGLILTDENQYRCTCGIAWTGFPILPELTNGSNCSACASDPNSLCPSTVESVAIYYHRPSYTPASVVYGNCFAFSEELQQSLQQSGDGVLASSWAGALLEAQQPSTCITECLLKGFPLGGVGDSASCWCFRDFPSGLSTFVCQSAGCLGSVALDGNRPAGVVDDLICGGFDQISLYGGIAHRVPNITTVPAAGTQLYRTEGDAGDMFTCNAQIDSIYLPLEVQWVNGSGSQDGNALSTAQLAVFNVSNDWTTTSRGGYSAGDFTFRCLATPTPDNSIPPQLARSDIAVTVFRIPTPAIVESGLPILATDLPGSTYSLDCINAVRGTPVGISWTGPTGTLESSNSTLHFPNPTRENEGSYTCSFTVEETNRPATGSFSVTLYETPVVDLPTARVHATGDLVRCSEFVSNIGNAAALLNYTWTLPSGVEVMADAIATHVPGTYTCVVVNTLLDTAGAGAAARGQDNLMVTVLPPVVVNTSVVGVEGSVVHRDSRTNDRYVVVPGASSSFNCTEFGGGNVTYRWLKVDSNGQTTVQTTQPYFTLTNVGADQDGQYQCEVTNPRIESASGTITALVIYDVFFTPQVTFPAEVVYAIIDEAYTLQCTVTGDQPDNFTWTMGGSEDVLGTEQNLTFTSVERINSGTYECSVSGQPVDTLPAYSHTATVELTAQAAASASLSREDSVIVEAGGEVEIQCTASGETPADASITWERDGQALQGQEERITLTRAGAVLTLSFSSILTADAGQYTCRVVDSTVGLQGRQTAMSTVQLSVTGADPQTDDTDNVPIIIGVVCGIVGLLLIVVLVVIIVKQWKKKAGNGGTDNPTYGESTAVDDEEDVSQGYDEVDGGLSSSTPIRQQKPALPALPALPEKASAAWRYCETGPTPEENAIAPYAAFASEGMMRHSFPPGKVESKSTSVNMLHCVSSAEVLTKIDDVDQSTTSKDAFPDADEEPLYNDPTKRTSFQAFPGGAPNNGAALAVSNVMYEVQSANSPSAAAARSPAARSPAPLPAYSPVPAYSPAPPAVYAQPDEFTGKHSDKSSTLASYSHLSFNPKEPDPALQAKLYEEPPDTEPAIYDRLAKQQCRQIPADDIRLLDQLRYSHFGNIHRAEWKQGDTSRQVVAKTVSSGSSQELKTKLLQEGVIMGQFHHENIIRLQGLVLQGPSMMLIWEFMDKGVLNTVLATMMPNASEKPRRHVKTMLLNMTRNIASAMEYLAGKGFVHRDLAARNILVNSKNVCKIGNFNMSRDLADRDYYLSSSIGLTPQSTSKWMAPETFISHLFSSASDVWSFGVVLYEMWTFGRSPYGAWSDQKVLEKITEGYRLPRPSHCPPSLGSIMVACWNEDRTRRPTFSEIVTTLSVKDVCLL